MVTPIHALPADYREIYHLDVLNPATMQTMSRGYMALTLASLVFFGAWGILVLVLRTAPVIAEFPSGWLWLGMVGVFFLHEWIHGLTIRWFGHRPRYGAIWATVRGVNVPLAFYATTDGAYFRRGEFVGVALAPLLVISLLVMGLLWVLPVSAFAPLVVCGVLNGGGAIGDVWMTRLVRQYPPDVLIRDEAQAIRIYGR